MEEKQCSNRYLIKRGVAVRAVVCVVAARLFSLVCAVGLLLLQLILFEFVQQRLHDHRHGLL